MRKELNMLKSLKISGGGGSLLAARSKGFEPLGRKNRGIDVWKYSRSDLPIRQKVKCWFSKTNLQFLLTYSPTHLLTSKAFTMAEILLSLTIIGVVAAITLPSLTGNVNERVWNTQKKALYARFSQALALMPSLSGYGSYSGTNNDGIVTATVDTAAETFLTEGLSKVLKINNICDSEHLADCGIPVSYTTLVGSINTFPKKMSELNSMFTGSYSDPSASYVNPQKDIDTKAAAFETQNGESIAVFYNPMCTGDIEGDNWHYAQPKMCANFIYDLNGNKGPNAVGKDIGFLTALYPTDSVIIAPMPLAMDVSEMKKQTDASIACTAMDSESRLPNRDELTSIFYNRDLVGMTGGRYWTSSVISSGETGMAWYIGVKAGHRYPYGRDNECNVRCIKR